MKKYYVMGVESGEVKSFKTLRDAQKFMKTDLKRFDKEQGIEDTYWIEEIEF